MRVHLRTPSENRAHDTNIRPRCMAHRRPVVMSIAAADPTCGAGLQADLLAIARLGCHPVTVLTALTMQDTRGVEAVWPVDPERVICQARCVAADMPIAAFKIGLLGSAAIAAQVAALLADYPDVPLVLDPVLASGRGDRLVDADLLHAIGNSLVPLADVVTPNIPELERLTAGRADASAMHAERAAQLIDRGADYVLVTGTHDATPEVGKTPYGRACLPEAHAWPRLPGSYHGSGCTLAAALAA